MRKNCFIHQCCLTMYCQYLDRNDERNCRQMTEATNFFYIMLHECTSVNSPYACSLLPASSCLSVCLSVSLLTLQLLWLLLSHAHANDLSDKLATCLPFLRFMQYVPRNNEMNHSTNSFVCALYYDADMCNKQNKSRRCFLVFQKYFQCQSCNCLSKQK